MPHLPLYPWSWKPFSYLPAWLPWPKWVTKPSCCHWCWLPVSASPGRLSGALGNWLSGLLSPDILRWVLVASFVAMAVWTLIPDKLDEDEQPSQPRYGVFLTTVALFFLAEMGDKTQIATVALAARFDDWLWVVAGTTIGMMLANVPVVFLGERITRLLPMQWVHRICAAIFIVLALTAALWP